jgi:sulfite reductase (NADPH) flavoprotein alpha-component
MAPVAISNPPFPAGVNAAKAALNGSATPYSTTSTAVSEAGDKSPKLASPRAEPTSLADGVTLIPGSPGYVEQLVGANAALPSTAPGATVYASGLEVLEALAVQNSSAVWVYDDAVQVGFGSRLAAWDAEDLPAAAGKVHPVETREGAGLEIAGYVRKAPAGKISVFASATTLPYLAANLARIEGDVVVHVAATATGADLELTDALAEAGVLKALTQLPEEWDVVFSAGADVIATGAHLYGAQGKVVHIVESTYAAREIQSYKFPAAGAFDEFVVLGEGAEVSLAVASHAASTLAGAKVVLNTLTPSPEKLAAALQSKATVTVTGPTIADAEALKAVVLAALYSAPTSSSAQLPAIKVAVTPAAAAAAQDAKVVSLFTAPNAPLPTLLAHLFFASPSLTTTLAQYGAVTVTGTKSVLALSQGAAVPLAPNTPSDLIWVQDNGVFKGTDVFATAKEGATVVIELPWTEEDLQSKLSAAEIKTIQDKKLRVFLLDLEPGCPLNVIREQVAFLLLYTGSQRLPKGVWKVLDAYHAGQLGRDQVEEGQAALFEIPPNVLSALEVDPEKLSKTKEAWTWDAVAGEPVLLEADATPKLSSWELAARHILFREAYAVPESGAKLTDADEVSTGVTALTPELDEETFLVTVSENRRLTPLTYDRNIFHLELDTKGTGLKYEIGEAIGIHGWNNTKDVEEFIEWYGLDPEAIVTIPNLEKPGQQTTRTVFQLLQQNLDLFGQPGKSFYADLSAFATQRDEAMKLKFISVPEGAELFARMADNETVNFADVLREFPSARPSIEQLLGLIPEIKPRHYSIASAQAVVGDKVELLIVTVDWVDTKGRTRYGQCTRYLVDLPVGAKVTVSIKPSVMKLPPLPTQPLIMAGLGTGAAPFRAFAQMRAHQMSQGVDVSTDSSYFFGSRHRSEEYLYGEELEAWRDAGVIGNLGLAFSRDQKHKIYIQHRIKEHGRTLAKQLLAEDPKNQGYFYLCGPTWPVPDIFNALSEALVEEGNMTREQAEQYLEDLKESERYVLEVY